MSVFILNTYGIWSWHPKDLLAIWGVPFNLTNAEGSPRPCSSRPSYLSAAVISHHLLIIAFDCVRGLFMCCLLLSLLVISADVWVSCCYMFFPSSIVVPCGGHFLLLIREMMKLFSVVLLASQGLFVDCQGNHKLIPISSILIKTFWNSPVELPLESAYRPRFKSRSYVLASYF